MTYAVGEVECELGMPNPSAPAESRTGRMRLLSLEVAPRASEDAQATRIARCLERFYHVPTAVTAAWNSPWLHPLSLNAAALKALWRTAARRDSDQRRQHGKIARALVRGKIARASSRYQCDVEGSLAPEPSLREAVPDLQELLEDVCSESPARQSLLHGERHWKAVTAAGLKLLPEVAGADPAVVFLFALLHDSLRANEEYDPEHGHRAAELAARLRGVDHFLSDGQQERLEVALADHDYGQTSGDPTIGLCWDADRLNLWRVGTEPRPELLSTEHARRAETIKWARTWPASTRQPGSRPDMNTSTRDGLRGESGR